MGPEASRHAVLKDTSGLCTAGRKNAITCIQRYFRQLGVGYLNMVLAPFVITVSALWSPPSSSGGMLIHPLGRQTMVKICVLLMD